MTNSAEPEEWPARVTPLCEAAVARLAERLPDAEVGCLVRVGDTFRHLAHAGRLHVIYEVGREQGGVVWRAAQERRAQLVADVRSDPDYLASDERVQAEIAAPANVRGEAVAVLDVEFPERSFGEDEAAVVRDEAERLARELEPYVS